MNHRIGILAYGSLIDDPGEEISKIETGRIKCKTPFKVEFARVSSTRSNAPTLIPVKIGGSHVDAQIIILPNNFDIDDARSILWRRERHIVGSNKSYTHIDNPGVNRVSVESINNFMNINTVLYTSLGSNINEKITGKLLAEKSINSILSEAGDKENDGIRYLLNTKQNGIITPLSKEYEENILLITESNSLEEAINKLDKKRNEV